MKNQSASIDFPFGAKRNDNFSKTGKGTVRHSA